MIALIYGLPEDARRVLKDALAEAYGGDDVIDINDISDSTISRSIRLSKSNSNVILVVLDDNTAEKYKEADNGLYMSDKFFRYKSLADFILFLNKKFEINLNLYDYIDEEEKEGVSSEETVQSVDAEKYESLEQELKSLRAEYEKTMWRLNDLESENSSLKDKLSSIRSEMTAKNKDEVSRLMLAIRAQKQQINKLQQREDTAISEIDITSYPEYKTLEGEVKKLRDRVKSLTESVRKKDSQIKELQGDLASATEESRNNTDRLQNYRNESISKDRKLSELSMVIDSLRREIDTLKTTTVPASELVALREELRLCKLDLEKVNNDNAILNRDMSNINNDLLNAQKELEERGTKIKSLEERVASDDEVITQLNKDNVELKSKLSVVEKVGGGAETSDLSNDLVNLKKEMVEIKRTVYWAMSTLAEPTSSQRIQVATGVGRLNNIRFFFAGSAGSRRGSYTCLYNELVNSQRDMKFLIVDLVSETSIDYEFQVMKMIPGVDWLKNGGDIQPYLSRTKIPNVQILSPGIKYVNDSFFLSINWRNRLEELETSGFKVFMFCGDLSNVIGRIFHESFADLGQSIIYVQGNAVGSRTLITNLRGITNGEKSLIGYFEYNDVVRPFFEIASRSNTCRILSRTAKK